jgi:hypothetical protein
MNRLARIWARPRTGRRTLLFTVDRPRRIDRVIDYFGDRLAPALLFGARAHAVSARETTASPRRPSIIPVTGVRRG